ncbi:MAG: F0F1 ATP synthase subunit epsilon [Acidobacteria bacterium]|nr:F0F1 ATP synthase subunit epsilon [Acidobacteriota bacterium]
MADTLPIGTQLRIVTPEREVVEGEISEVSIPGKGGYLGVLPGHAPLLTELQPGDLTYRQDGLDFHVAIHCGFAEVLPDRVIILADAAERAEEIDVERAERARRRAEERLKQPSESEEEMREAREALRRAICRLETARHAKA